MVRVDVVLTVGAFVVAPLPLSERKKVGFKIHGQFFQFSFNVEE